MQSTPTCFLGHYSDVKLQKLPPFLFSSMLSLSPRTRAGRND